MAANSKTAKAEEKESGQSPDLSAFEERFKQLDQKVADSQAALEKAEAELKALKEKSGSALNKPGPKRYTRAEIEEFLKTEFPPTVFFTRNWKYELTVKPATRRYNKELDIHEQTPGVQVSVQKWVSFGSELLRADGKAPLFEFGWFDLAHAANVTTGDVKDDDPNKHTLESALTWLKRLPDFGEGIFPARVAVEMIKAAYTAKWNKEQAEVDIEAARNGAIRGLEKSGRLPEAV